MKITKVTFNLPTNLISKLKKYSAEKDLTVTDVIRQSIEVNFFLSEEEEEGNKILIEKSDGKFIRLVRK